MENMGATRALGKKMRALSLWQKIIIAIIALGALAGLVIGAVMFWPAPHVDNFQFPIVR
jgi:fucose permease